MIGPLAAIAGRTALLSLRGTGGAFVGVVFFLAGVGTRSGWALVTTIQSGGALPLFLLGAALTALVATLVVAGGWLLKIPSSMLVGVLAGVQTQPADLTFALEQAKNEMPTVGYASVYPMATIAKIVLAQVVLIILERFP